MVVPCISATGAESFHRHDVMLLCTLYTRIVSCSNVHITASKHVSRVGTRSEVTLA
jgi:hypothetical protein